MKNSEAVKYAISASRNLFSVHHITMATKSRHLLRQRCRKGPQSTRQGVCNEQKYCDIHRRKRHRWRDQSSSMPTHTANSICAHGNRCIINSYAAELQGISLALQIVLDYTNQGGRRRNVTIYIDNQVAIRLLSGP